MPDAARRSGAPAAPAAARAGRRGGPGAGGCVFRELDASLRELGVGDIGRAEAHEEARARILRPRRMPMTRCSIRATTHAWRQFSPSISTPRRRRFAALRVMPLRPRPRLPRRSLEAFLHDGPSLPAPAAFAARGMPDDARNRLVRSSRPVSTCGISRRRASRSPSKRPPRSAPRSPRISSSRRSTPSRALPAHRDGRAGSRRRRRDGAGQPDLRRDPRAVRRRHRGGGRGRFRRADGSAEPRSR